MLCIGLPLPLDPQPFLIGCEFCCCWEELELEASEPDLGAPATAAVMAASKRFSVLR